MRNISLSDLTVAQAGGHTVISIGDHLQHFGPVEGIYYENALDLSALGFSRRQVACILHISEQEVGQLATGNRPYPELFQMQNVRTPTRQNVDVRIVKGRQPQSSRTSSVNSRTRSSEPQYDPHSVAMFAVLNDDTPRNTSHRHDDSPSHSRHDDTYHSPSYDSPSNDSGSSDSGGSSCD